LPPQPNFNKNYLTRREKRRQFIENVFNLFRRFSPGLARFESSPFASQPFEFHMFKYSYDSLVYFGEPVDRSIARLARFGYDAIELIGEPDKYDTKEVTRLVGDHGIKVSSICSIFTAERDLASPDKNGRAKAVDYVKQVADLAAAVSCPTIIIAPTACMKMTRWKDPAEERKWAVESIRTGGEYLASVGVGFAIEAWNRYESYFVNRLEQCVEIVKEVGLRNGGVMGDTFHMNIEERDIADAYRKAGDYLKHVHLADSDRAAPGQGHIDFLPILHALKEMDYQGYVAFELLPASGDPFGALEKGEGKEFFDQYTEQAIRTIKKLEQQLT
jgi:sugar phosphate isomerase/epimerase